MKNEMIKETKVKIKRYGQMKDLVLVRKKELEMQLQILNMSEDELTKKRILKVIDELNVEIQKLEKDILSIEKGLSHLDDISLKIVQMKYMRKESWVAVSLNVGYGQTRCKELGRNAVIVIGEFLNGIMMHQDLPLVSGATYY